MRESVLRIEMVLPSLPRAGMEVMAALLARGLARRGHEVGFTCVEAEGALGTELAREGFRVTLLPVPGVLPNFIPTALARWFRRLQPDVAHVHSGVWLKGVQACKAAHVPRAVHTMHGHQMHGRELADPWYHAAYSRRAARRTDVIVAVSESLKQYAVADLGLPAQKVCVIANGVSTARRRTAAGTAQSRRQLDLPADALVIGTLARMDPIKDQGTLVSAFRILRERLPSARLVFIGDGPERSRLEAQIAALGLTDAVRITGQVENSLDYLEALDLFALPSLSEGTSMSLLEAMVMEVPIVATAVGGTPAVLRDGARGVLVPPRGAAALADALCALAVNPQARVAYAAAGRRAVETEYSDEAMTDSYERAYLAAGAPAGAGLAS